MKEQMVFARCITCNDCIRVKDMKARTVNGQVINLNAVDVAHKFNEYFHTHFYCKTLVQDIEVVV